MSKLIVIVGASGTGKTTLARALAKAHPFLTGYEGHLERPFQALFKQDARYALANQLDYLLFRAEQERELRASPKDALVDGGLDLDFHGFTRLFHARGLLTDEEYDLCRRLYFLLRGPLTLRGADDTAALRQAPPSATSQGNASDLGGLNGKADNTAALRLRSTEEHRFPPLCANPPPDLIIALSAPGEVVRERLANRNRINIASGEDAELFNSFLAEWLETVPPEKLLRLDVSKEGPEYPLSVKRILERI